MQSFCPFRPFSEFADTTIKRTKRTIDSTDSLTHPTPNSYDSASCVRPIISRAPGRWVR